MSFSRDKPYFLQNVMGEIEVWRLRELREDSDKKQADIAEPLGISRQHYSLYELSYRELPMHHFITLAKYYSVTLDYLGGLDKQKHLPSGVGSKVFIFDEDFFA